MSEGEIVEKIMEKIDEVYLDWSLDNPLSSDILSSEIWEAIRGDVVLKGDE